MQTAQNLEDDMKKMELLCPAGDAEQLKMSVKYGADAVYLAGTSFGMRSFAGNFSPEALPEAFSSLVRFCQGGADGAQQKQTEASSGGSSEPLFDYHCDAAYFIGSFQQAYGIDLTVDRVHWWRFQALLRSLPCDTALGRILDFRGADTSEMDEAHREYYEAMKERYALPPDLKGVKRVETLQEHEAAFIDRFG